MPDAEMCAKNFLVQLNGCGNNKRFRNFRLLSLATNSCARNHKVFYFSFIFFLLWIFHFLRTHAYLLILLLRIFTLLHACVFVVMVVRSLLRSFSCCFVSFSSSSAFHQKYSREAAIRRLNSCEKYLFIVCVCVCIYVGVLQGGKSWQLGLTGFYVRARISVCIMWRFCLHLITLVVAVMLFLCGKYACGIKLMKLTCVRLRRSSFLCYTLYTASVISFLRTTLSLLFSIFFLFFNFFLAFINQYSCLTIAYCNTVSNKHFVIVVVVVVYFYYSFQLHKRCLQAVSAEVFVVCVYLIFPALLRLPLLLLFLQYFCVKQQCGRQWLSVSNKLIGKHFRFCFGNPPLHLRTPPFLWYDYPSPLHIFIKISTI